MSCLPCIFSIGYGRIVLPFHVCNVHTAESDSTMADDCHTLSTQSTARLRRHVHALRVGRSSCSGESVPAARACAPSRPASTGSRAPLRGPSPSSPLTEGVSSTCKAGDLHAQE